MICADSQNDKQLNKFCSACDSSFFPLPSCSTPSILPSPNQPITTKSDENRILKLMKLVTDKVTKDEAEEEEENKNYFSFFLILHHDLCTSTIK